MAAPVVASFSADVATADADTALTAAAPSGLTAGDLLLMIGTCLAARTLTPDAGFSLVDSDANADNRSYLWKKTATGSDNLDVTVSGTFGKPRIVVLRITGADAASLVTETAVSGSNDNTIETPVITTVSVDNLILHIGTNGTNTTASSTITEVCDEGAGTLGNIIAVYSEEQAAAGNTTSRTITTGGFAKWTAYTVAVPPSGGGGGGTKAPPIYRRRTRFFKGR